MKKNIFILVIILLAVGFEAQAQQEAMYTHYMYNTLEMNPAYAGSRGALSLVGLQRNQWVGFDGAPVTQGISLNSPIFGDHLAGGLSMGSDKIGPIKTTHLNLSFAYRMKVSEDARLSFGINAGFNSLNTQFARLDLTTPLDEAFAASGQSEWAPNFGFGMYYTTSKWYAGISAPRLLENNFKASNVSSVSLMQSARHYYAIGGALLTISPTVQYRPSCFIKAVAGAPLQIDITNQFIFHDLFWLGSMIRTGDGAGVLAGFNINSSMQFGYAYDWSYGFGRVSNHNGSHELMLRYELKYGRQEKIKSPRYF